MYKDYLVNNAKNVFGRQTNRKIVIFSVDDYGNVRLDSKEARQEMNKKGLKVLTRFDAFDSLETSEDLEALYETLRSVRDKNGRAAVFTPFSLPCNIDFESVIKNNYANYVYELLPVTFDKLGVPYQRAMQIWKEGIADKIMLPQFHGREHLNLKIFQEKLEKRDYEVLTSISNRSYTSISKSGYKTISVMAAFEFWDLEENSRFNAVISDGLKCFEDVFGYKSIHFNSPGGREHPIIHAALKAAGIKFIDTPWVKLEHQGKGKYKRVINYTGKKNNLDQFYCVRNCLFEPSVKKSFDWIGYTLKQIDAAFKWNKPAIISSHRVNFSGHVSIKNRNEGLLALNKLLKEITHRWPEVEFMSADEMCLELFKV